MFLIEMMEYRTDKTKSKFVNFVILCHISYFKIYLN